MEKETGYDMCDIMCEIEKANCVINELIQEYDSCYELSPHKAIEYGQGRSKSGDAKMSFKFLFDYNKIMMFLRIANDYCTNVYEVARNTVEQ